MRPPVLLVGRDPAAVRRVRDDFISGGLLNPVVACADGAEAVAYLLGLGEYACREQHPLPSVVVTDLALASGGGLEVLRTVREHALARSTPVIVVGTDAGEEEITALHDLGVTAYLSHHVAPRALLDVIRALPVPWALGRVEAGV